MTTTTIPASIKPLVEERTFLINVGDIECIVTQKIDHVKHDEFWELSEINTSGLSIKVQELFINAVKDHLLKRRI